MPLNAAFYCPDCPEHKYTSIHACFEDSLSKQRTIGALLCSLLTRKCCWLSIVCCSFIQQKCVMPQALCYLPSWFLHALSDLVYALLPYERHGEEPGQQVSQVAAALEPCSASHLAALHSKGLPKALLSLQLRSAALWSLLVPRHVLLLLHLSPAATQLYL